MAPQNRNVLVIGATGNQGTGVIQHLLSASSSPNDKNTYTPYALTRDPSSPRAQALASQFPALNLLQGDVDDPASLSSAMATGGAEIHAVFFIIMPSKTGDADSEIQQARNVVQAAQNSGTVETVIYSGAAWTGRTDGYEGDIMKAYWKGKRGCEHVVRDETEGTKMKWAIIRPATFLQNWLPPFSGVLYPEFTDRQQRTMRVGYREDLKLDVVDCSDVGKVVVQVLEKPEKYAGRGIDIAGEAVTMAELAEKIERAVGEKVEVECLDPDVLAAERPGGFGERLMAAPKMFNKLGNYFDADECRKEFGLTTVEEFFGKNKERVFS